MKRNVELEATIVAKYTVVSPVLDEHSRRRWAAAESMSIGYGGDALVSSARVWPERRSGMDAGKSRKAKRRQIGYDVRVPGGPVWNRTRPVC